MELTHAEIADLEPPTLVNLRGRWDCDVYIGRPSKLGNPFRVSRHGRARAIELYREYLLARPALIEIVRGLGGKRLGCYCAPQPCHGDVIIEVWKQLHGVKSNDPATPC